MTAPQPGDPAPEQTDNRPRDDDGPQDDVSQDPAVDLTADLTQEQPT